LALRPNKITGGTLAGSCPPPSGTIGKPWQPQNQNPKRLVNPDPVIDEKKLMLLL
jgi:hypothetical protein